MGQSLSPRDPFTWLLHSSDFPNVSLTPIFPPCIDVGLSAFPSAPRYLLQPPKPSSVPIHSPWIFLFSWDPSLSLHFYLPDTRSTRLFWYPCCHCPRIMPATHLLCVLPMSELCPSERLGICTPKLPDLVFLGGPRDTGSGAGCQGPAWGGAWAGDPCHSWVSVTHRLLTAPPQRLVTLTPVSEHEAHRTNWEGGGPASH